MILTKEGCDVILENEKLFGVLHMARRPNRQLKNSGNTLLLPRELVFS